MAWRPRFLKRRRKESVGTGISDRPSVCGEGSSVEPKQNPRNWQASILRQSRSEGREASIFAACLGSSSRLDLIVLVRLRPGAEPPRRGGRAADILWGWPLRGADGCDHRAARHGGRGAPTSCSYQEACGPPPPSRGRAGRQLPASSTPLIGGPAGAGLCRSPLSSSCPRRASRIRPRAERASIASQWLPAFQADRAGSNLVGYTFEHAWGGGGPALWSFEIWSKRSETRARAVLLASWPRPGRSEADKEGAPAGPWPTV